MMARGNYGDMKSDSRNIEFPYEEREHRTFKVVAIFNRKKGELLEY